MFDRAASLISYLHKQIPMPRSERVVFIVDDEIVIAETLATILNQSGFSATAFTDPALARTIALTEQPDVLITDVVMLGMTGIDLAIHFYDVHPQCRVLLMSGETIATDLLEKANSAGYDFEILVKPVHPGDLLAKLHAWDYGNS
jgi:DNA-binding response OmpR family regulator